MKKLLLLLSVIVSFSAFSQITITRADYGSIGDKVLYAVDSPASASLSVGTSGANQNWNFASGTLPDMYDSMMFLTTVGVPNAPSGANILLRSNSGGDQFQEVATGYVKSIFDQPKLGATGIKIKLLTFPVTYLSNSADSTNFSVKGTPADFGSAPITGVDSVRIDVKLNSNAVCDGWGTITLPDSAYNCLRLKNTIITNADIYVRMFGSWTPSPIANQLQTNMNYQWLANGTKNFVAQAMIDSVGNVKSFTYKVKKLPKNYGIAKLTSITPGSAMQGTTLNVTITGTATSFTQGAGLTVSFYGQGSSVVVNSFTASNDSTITASVTVKPNAPTGYYEVQVNDPVTGLLKLGNVFLVTPKPLASLKSVSPSVVSKLQTLNITIIGLNTHFAQASNTITITPQVAGKGTIKVNSLTAANDTTLTCSITVDSNAVTSALFNITVYNNIDLNMFLNGSISILNTGIVNAQATDENIKMYPNPADRMLTVSFAHQQTISSVEIYDLTGRMLVNTPAKSGDHSIDISNLNNGIYFCKIYGDGFVKSEKFIISR